MAVTELTLIRALSDDSARVPSAELLVKLRRAKEVLKSSSGHSFSFFQQIEDPTFIYIIGSWSSPAAHEAFLPSSPNLALLDSFKGHIDTENIVMYHVDLDADVSPLPLDAPVISINRHFVKSGQRDAFQKRFEEVKPLLEDYTKPRPVAGGWRMEKEAADKDEWILFSGFDSVEHHVAFAKTDEFQTYRGILDLVDGFGLRHIKRLEGV